MAHETLVEARLLVFREVLEDEGIVRVDRLRELSKEGVPQQLRGEVWKYLLGIVQPEQPGGATTPEGNDDAQARAAEYARLHQAVSEEQAEISQLRWHAQRYQRKGVGLGEADLRRRLVRIVGSFLEGHEVPFSRHLVHLCGPLLACIRPECDCFFALCTLHAMTAKQPPLGERLGQLLALLGFLLGDLYRHLQDEQVAPQSWAASWLEGLLSQELPIPCALRLWDTYLAEGDLDLHPFVCLAILDNRREELEELEDIELRHALQTLPDVDVEEVLISAHNFRYIAKGLLPQ